MYLIMKCDPWGHGFDSTPIAFVKKWKKWFKKNHPQYFFEVWKWQDGEFVLEKDGETPVERGTALYFWEKGHWNRDEMPTVVQKWVNLTEKDAIPEDVFTFAMRCHKDIGTLECGYGWEDDEGNWWVYGEYRDHWYESGLS